MNSSSDHCLRHLLFSNSLCTTILLNSSNHRGLLLHAPLWISRRVDQRRSPRRVERANARKVPPRRCRLPRRMQRNGHLIQEAVVLLHTQSQIIIFILSIRREFSQKDTEKN